MVFVPYRGLIFLNSKKDFVGELQEVFPSPTGDLYFSMAFGILYFENGIRVSVPYRGLIFLNCSGFNFARGFESVSVPYRGLIFLNTVSVDGNIKQFTYSFRPLPGTYISQSAAPIQTFHTKSTFPSPTGDLYFSIPSPQFLVNTDCITQFAWEMIFQKYKFIFHYKKLSKCLFYAVRGKTNIF